MRRLHALRALLLATILPTTILAQSTATASTTPSGCPTGTPFATLCCAGTLLTAPTTSILTLTFTPPPVLPTANASAGTGILVLPPAALTTSQPTILGDARAATAGTGTLVRPFPITPSVVPFPPGASPPPAVPEGLSSVLASLSRLAESLEAEAGSARVTIVTVGGGGRKERRQVASGGGSTTLVLDVATTVTSAVTSSTPSPTLATVMVSATATVTTSATAIVTASTISTASTTASTSELMTSELAPGVTCVGAVFPMASGMGATGNMTGMGGNATGGLATVISTAVATGSGTGSAAGSASGTRSAGTSTSTGAAATLGAWVALPAMAMGAWLGGL